MVSSQYQILGKRDDGNASIVAWIIPPALLLTISSFFIIRCLWKNRRAKQHARTTQTPIGVEALVDRLQQRSQYSSASTSAFPHGSSAAAGRSSDTVGHELQEEMDQSGHERSNNRLSVRSIMTLPPYHVAPLPSERLIAREGERDGVDTVVEYPEGDTELEERREEEMQALYNIREARRRENEERAARRAARRAAAEQRDWQRVTQLDAEERAARARRAASGGSSRLSNSEPDNGGTSLESGQDTLQPDSNLLIAQLHSLRDHNSQNRRISSVSYADLGVARHDGSRIRADSAESDRRPLLDSAAPLGSGDRSRASSIISRSASRSRATLQISHDRRPGTPGSILSQNDGSSLFHGSTTGDLPPEPPSYEDDLSVHGGEVPPYEDPLAPTDRGPRMPLMEDVHREDERHTSPMLVIQPAEENQPVSPISGSAVPNQPSLLLDTSGTIVPPNIEVVQATPVTTSSASFLNEERR